MSLHDSIYHEDFHSQGGSLYYSDLPIRSHIQKDKYKHWGRRVLFYLLLAYFIAATVSFSFLIKNLTFWFWLIHVLWFELDLTTNKNNFFVQVLHSLSFVGSYVIMITSIILLVILNPEFIANRAKIENHSIAFAWSQNILIHWIPPLLLTLDLVFHKEHIRKRHRIFFNKRRNNGNAKAWIKDFVKALWCIASPMVVVGIWFGSGFTIESVYGVTNYNLSYLVPSMVVVDIILGVFLIYYIRKRDADTYIRLNS
ncbi:hypothetical protein CYY_002995 [Polysphondylium violaceum]|uniref:Transmembrane protein n=1 Tax=Polysphondylium violaceum TaxID=133409 RepID=A0A8J4PZ56_9MYCE|nr:hypothetical protein CYY_002995 [Polysphondylium violaceum]